MAKLYFRYGAMNSGKTANLLMVADNYLKQGKEVLILKPNKDTRWDMVMVKSRAIREALPATLVADGEDLFVLVENKHKQTPLNAVLVEEAQFLTAKQVRDLAIVVDELNLPVLCYGLRCSFIDGELFSGSAALMYWADTIEEIKNVCQFCNRKATMNLLKINGVPQYGGESSVVIGDVEGGDEVLFTPVCRHHYLHPL